MIAASVPPKNMDGSPSEDPTNDGQFAPGATASFIALLQARWYQHLPAGSLRRRFASGAFWTAIGLAVAQGLGAITGILVARILGAEGFGTLGIVTSTLGMFQVVAEFSLGLTTNKHVAEFYRTDPHRAGRIIGLTSAATAVMGTLIATILVVFSPYLATHVLREPQVAPYLQLAAPILVLSAINGVQSGTLAGYESFRLLTIGRIFTAFITLPLMVVGAWWDGVRGALVAIVALAVIRFIWFRVAINRHSRQRGVVISYRGVWQEAPVLLRFALPSMLAAALYSPVVWAANAMLVQSPNGLVEMGKFNAASSWRGLIVWLPTAIGQVALPIFTSLVSSGDRHRLARVVKWNVAVNLLLAIIVASPICFGSYWIMMLYGVEFSSSWPALVFLSGAAVFHATATVIGDVIASASRMWWGFFLNLLWAIELLVFTWCFVGHGAVGLGAAFFLSYLLHLVQVGCYTGYLLHFDPVMSGRS